MSRVTLVEGGEMGEPHKARKAYLTQDQIDSFNQDGYIIVDFLLDHDMLDRVVESLHPHFPPEFHANPTSPARIQDAWRFVDEVRQLAVNQNALHALEQLFGRQPKPFQTLNFPIGTRQNPHSDTIHFNTIPKGYMAGVWIALEDIDEDNGPLVYFPGSHKLPEYNMQDLGLQPGYAFYKDYERAIGDLVREKALQASYGLMKKGQALIWHANLIHGGAPQKDLSRSRHSQVTHYYFADCKYYTPMNSKEGSLDYRKPVWILATKPDPSQATGGAGSLPILRKLRSFLGRIKRRLMHQG